MAREDLHYPPRHLAERTLRTTKGHVGQASMLLKRLAKRRALVELWRRQLASLISGGASAALTAEHTFRCVRSNGVAYRRTPGIYDRVTERRGPDDGDTIVATLVEAGKWLRAEVEGLGTVFLPFFDDGTLQWPNFEPEEASLVAAKLAVEHEAAELAKAAAKVRRERSPGWACRVSDGQADARRARAGR